MNAPEIRNASPSDFMELAELIGAFRDHLKASGPTDSEIRGQLGSVLRDPLIEFGCAWLNGRAVGYTQLVFCNSVWVPGLEARLEDLFVLSEARRRSVGRSLLRYAVDRATSRGARRVTLTTNERNDLAQMLYRSEGFAPVSHGLYPDGREVLWVRKVGAV